MVFGLCRWGIYWDRPGSIVPVCGAYAVAPYAFGSRFLSVRVGAYYIRPIRRPRQGDECGYPVISQGDLFGPSGPCRARLWGVCNTPLPCRSIVFIQMGRGATAYAPSDVPDKGTNVGVRLGCHVRIWDCGGVGGGVTGPFLGLRRGGNCQYGRYFELLRGGD